MAAPRPRGSLEPVEDDDDLDVLTRDEIRSLRLTAPQRLFRHLAQVEREFLFGVAARRRDPQDWGGEWEVTINRNVTLHFVPDWNQGMTCLEELPQFTVFPSLDCPDTVEETAQQIDEEETVAGAVFWVDPTDYEQMIEELAGIEARYGDLDILPDTWFLDTQVIDLITRVVLEHPTVKAERQFDWRRGLVGGPAPSQELPAEPELPRIEDVDDPEGDDEPLAGPSGDESELDYEVIEGEHLRTIVLRPQPPRE